MTTDNHDDDDETGLTGACHPEHGPAHRIGDAGQKHSCRQDVDGPHGDHCRVGEPREGLGWGDQSGEGNREEDEHGDHVDPEFVYGEQHDRPDDDCECQRDVKRHIAPRVCGQGFGTTRRPPPTK